MVDDGVKREVNELADSLQDLQQSGVLTDLSMHNTVGKSATMLKVLLSELDNH